MSLLDTASLIVTPNGVKEGKLYSVIPSDGSGDMSVVRATTATRVNSAGLVELVPYNLFTYSQTFSNADWTKANVTVTGGQSGYDGSSNAFLLTDNSTNDYHIVIQTPIVSGQYTISVYAKANTLNWLLIRGVQSSANVRAWFNLSTGVVGIVETNGTATIENVGNGWYRCSLTIADFQSGFESYIGMSNANGTSNYVGSGQSIYIQNAQSNLGLIKDYQKTETRLNIPRLDYSNGTCPSLLVEPQRTNICLDSNNLSGSNWINQIYNTTLTRIASGGADGNAYDRLVTTGSGNQGRYVQFASLTGTSATFSVYLRGTGIADIAIYNGGQSSLDTITLTSEWKRYETTITSGTTGYIDWSIFSFGGTTVDVSCIQMELGSYSTSYIPTTSASVTRNADVVSKTGISSLIGQTEGTVYWEGQVNGFGQYPQLFDLNANGNKFIQIFNSVVLGIPRIGIYVQNVGVLLIDGNIATISYDTNFKFALGYKANDYVVYLNGTQVYANTTIGVPPTSNFGLGDAEQGGSTSKKNVKATALWKTRLTNTQLAQLTTI